MQIKRTLYKAHGGLFLSMSIVGTETCHSKVMFDLCFPTRAWIHSLSERPQWSERWCNVVIISLLKKSLNSSKSKRKLVAFLLLSYRCIVTINVLSQWLLLTVPWVGLQCVIVVYPDHSHLLFEN